MTPRNGLVLVGAVVRVELTQGQVAIADAIDIELLAGYRWFAVWAAGVQSYYASAHTRRPDGRRYLLGMHRLILGLKHGDRRQGDHIHHDTLDNRRSQLCIVTNRQNSQNLRSPGTSKHPGVSWVVRDRCWRACFWHDGRLKHIGYFDNEAAAAEAYQRTIEGLA